MRASPEEVVEIMAGLLEDKKAYCGWLASAALQLNLPAHRHLKRIYTAKDMVDEVFLKFADGERTWDPDLQPDFSKQFLLSLISHIRNISKKEKRLPLVHNEEINGEAEGDIAVRRMLASTEQPIDAVVCEKIEGETLLADAMSRLADDEDAGIVFLCLAEDRTNIEAAEHLGVDRAFIENAKKRIKRKLQPLFPALNNSWEL